MRYHHRMHPGSMAFHHRFYSPYLYRGAPYVYVTNPVWEEDPYYHKQEPVHWIGRLLVRKGQKAPPNYPDSAIVYENSIPDRYAIVGPMQTTSGYDHNRLLIYVNEAGIIDNIRWG